MLSTVTYRQHAERPASSRNGRADLMALSARHQLLSNSSRAAYVRDLEEAIGRFTFEPNVTDQCEVALFEIEGDEHLHCNVTHRHATKSVAGWAGPGSVPNGFVYNRRFRDVSQNNIIRHIRDMVFAPRV